MIKKKAIYSTIYVTVIEKYWKNSKILCRLLLIGLLLFGLLLGLLI